MSAITAVLDSLWHKRQAIAEVQRQIDDAAGPLVDRKATLEAEAKSLEADAKAKAKYIPDAQRHTLRGNDLQLVYSETRSLNYDVLPEIVARYGISEDDLNRLVTLRPGWSIRKVGK